MDALPFTLPHFVWGPIVPARPILFTRFLEVILLRHLPTGSPSNAQLPTRRGRNQSYICQASSSQDIGAKLFTSRLPSSSCLLLYPRNSRTSEQGAILTCEAFSVDLIHGDQSALCTSPNLHLGISEPVPIRIERIGNITYSFSAILFSFICIPMVFSGLSQQLFELPERFHAHWAERL